MLQHDIIAKMDLQPVISLPLELIDHAFALDGSLQPFTHLGWYVRYCTVAAASPGVTEAIPSAERCNLRSLALLS